MSALRQSITSRRRLLSADKAVSDIVDGLGIPWCWTFRKLVYDNFASSCSISLPGIGSIYYVLDGLLPDSLRFVLRSLIACKSSCNDRCLALTFSMASDRLFHRLLMEILFFWLSVERLRILWKRSDRFLDTESRSRKSLLLCAIARRALG